MNNFHTLTKLINGFDIKSGTMVEPYLIVVGVTRLSITMNRRNGRVWNLNRKSKGSATSNGQQYINERVVRCNWRRSRMSMSVNVKPI